MILLQRFRARVLTALDQQSMTKAELARRMRVPGPYVYPYLTGRKSPGLEVVERFAAALDLDPGELLAPEHVEMVR